MNNLNDKEEKKEFVKAVMDRHSSNALDSIKILLPPKIKSSRITEDEIIEKINDFSHSGSSKVESLVKKAIESFFDLAKNIKTDEKIIAISGVKSHTNTLIHNLKRTLTEPDKFETVYVKFLNDFSRNFFSSPITLKYYAEMYSSVNEYLLKEEIFDINEPDILNIKIATHSERQNLVDAMREDRKNFIQLFSKNITDEEKSFLYKSIDNYSKAMIAYIKDVYNDNEILSIVIRDKWIKEFSLNNSIQKNILGAKTSKNIMELVKLIKQYNKGGLNMTKLIDPELLNTFIKEKNLAGILNVLLVSSQIENVDLYNEKLKTSFSIILDLEKDNVKNDRDRQTTDLRIDEIGREVLKGIDSSYKIYLEKQKNIAMKERWDKQENILCDQEQLKTKTFEVNLENLNILTGFSKNIRMDEAVLFFKNMGIENVFVNSCIKQDQNKKSIAYLVIHIMNNDVEKIEKREIEEMLVKIFMNENFQLSKGKIDKNTLELVNNELREVFLNQKLKNEKDSNVSRNIVARQKI